MIDVLMADLAGHDHMPSAFLVYLFLWRKAHGPSQAIRCSYRHIAEGTGLSKSAAYKAVQHLIRRRLIKRCRSPKTAVPLYNVNAPWRSR